MALVLKTTFTGPRYQLIEAWVRELCKTGRPGELLPSESELAAKFGVSRMTARQAMQNLTLEGLVERRKGSGTYIAEQPLHRHEGTLLSFSEDMRRRGMVATSKLLNAQVRRANRSEIEALALDGDDRVVFIHRIRLADGVPLAIERVVLPTDCAAVLSVDLERGSLHEALAWIGRRAQLAESWISARMPTPSEAAELELTGEAEPLLVERRIIRDQDDRRIEFTESAYIAARYVIDVTFRMDAGTPQARFDPPKPAPQVSPAPPR